MILILAHLLSDYIIICVRVRTGVYMYGNKHNICVSFVITIIVVVIVVTVVVVVIYNILY